MRDDTAREPWRAVYMFIAGAAFSSKPSVLKTEKGTLMEEKKKFQLRFNQILHEEMRKHFTLRLLQLDPDFKLKYSGDDVNAYIKKKRILGLSKNSRDTCWGN